MNPFIALLAVAFVGLVAYLAIMVAVSFSTTARRAQELDLLYRTGRLPNKKDAAK